MLFGFEISVIVLMLIVNALFATYEMALASLSHARLVTLSHQKKKGADQALYMKERMEASLAFIQLGITLAAAIAAATGGAGVHEYLTPYLRQLFNLPLVLAEALALICFVIPLSAITIVFAELVPKMFALTNKEWVCLAFSPAMKVLAGIANPVVSLFENVVKLIMGTQSKKARHVSANMKQSLHEIRAAAALARTSHLIGADEEKIMLSAAQLLKRRVSDIVLPASDISMIPLTDSLSEALIKAHLDMHTRFPVCRNKKDTDSILGYVNFKDIVSALKVNPKNPTIEGIIRPIKRVRSDLSLSQVLSEMIHEKAHIALIVSQEDRVLGMITLEDILEELVGEIEDEYDRLPAYVHPFGSNWIVGGGVSIDSLSSMIKKKIPVRPSNSHTTNLAGWVTEHLARQPHPGETLDLEGLKITVRKLRRKKLYEALVHVTKGPIEAVQIK